MKKHIIKITTITLFLLLGCNDDDTSSSDPVFTTAIEGSFTFCVDDGIPDNVTGITITESNNNLSQNTWVVTDNDNIILSLPATQSELEAIDFDVLDELDQENGSPGVRFIWYLEYDSTLSNLSPGINLDILNGNYDLSQTAVKVERNKTFVNPLEGGPYFLCINENAPIGADAEPSEEEEDEDEDEEEDIYANFIKGFSISGDGLSGSNTRWLITDDSGVIVRILESQSDLEGFNFNILGVQNSLVWYIRYEDDVTGIEIGANASGISGCFALSNSIAVSSNMGAVTAASLTGGTFSFCMDGTADNVSNIGIDETEAVGTNNSWLVTDTGGNILNLSNTPAEIEAIDFDDPQSGGTNYIWNIRYEDGLFGLEENGNVNNLVGCFAISDSLEVKRTLTAVPNNAGTISGGPFDFVDDGTADFVSGITLDDVNFSGTSRSWVVTDASGVILAIPATMEELEALNFDNINIGGNCFIWHLSYEDSVLGLSTFNTVGDISGCFALSNSIEVTKS